MKFLLGTFLFSMSSCSSLLYETPAPKKEQALYKEIKDKHWKYESSIDSMSGKKSYSAMNLSLNNVSIDYPIKGKTQCGFGITKSDEDSPRAILAVNYGIINFVEGRWIRIKFDEAESEQFQIREFGNGKGGMVALETYPDERFWKKLHSAKKMRVELLLYGDGLKEFTFHVEKLQPYFAN